MAIKFPQNPVDGTRYPTDSDTEDFLKTGGVVFEYEASTKSWNIAGPDNVATTDWVLGQQKDDKADVDKGYDLISSTNNIGIVANYNYTEDSSALTHYNSHLLSSRDPNGLSYVDAVDYAVEQWELYFEDPSHPEREPGAGIFEVCGSKKEAYDDASNDTIKSFEIGDVDGFYFSKTDADGNAVDWLYDTTIGDTIEINYRGGSGDNIYLIVRIREKRDYTGYIGVQVDYQASNEPDRIFPPSTSITNYEFKTFKKAYNVAGGQIDGPVRIHYDNNESLVVENTDPTLDPTLTVDTIDNKVIANKDYDSKLGFTFNSGVDDYTSEELLCTLGYVTRRFGGNVRPDTNVGPWMQLAGGEWTGTGDVIWKGNHVPAGQEGGLVVKGRYEANGTRGAKLFTIRRGDDDTKPDYMLYRSEEVDEDLALLNNLAIKTKIQASQDLCVLIAGSTMTGRLNLYDHPPRNPGNTSYDKMAATKKYVDEKPMGAVSDVQISTPGMFWSTGGNLYFNPYGG